MRNHILLPICRIIIVTAWLSGHADSVASAACPEVQGAEVIFERPSTGVVWVGEMHGTSEMPALFADLVCVASKMRGHVVVALERRADEQPLWDRYLVSDGGPAARAALLKGSEWRSPVQDGRNSVAMLALAERLRDYKAHGQITAVTLIWPANVHTGAEHEADLANSVIDTIRHYPDTLVLAYSGMMHAMKTAAPYDKTVALAASLIPASERVTVNLVGGDGEAWSCLGGMAAPSPGKVTARDLNCGPHPHSGSNQPRGIVPIAAAMDDTSKNFANAYDAVGYTGRATTASPPAVDVATR